MAKIIKKDLIIITLLLLVVTLPFINKAFHIDDEVVLSFAQKISFTSPLSILNEELSNLGHKSKYMKKTHGLLLPLFVKTVNIINKKNKEWPLHLSFFLFSFIAVISTYFLDIKSGGEGLWTTFLLIVSPVFMVMSQNIMFDIPAMSCSLLAVTLFVYGIQKKGNGFLKGSAVFSTCAFLISFQMLIIPVILLIYSFIKKEKRAYLYALIPVIIFIVISIMETIIAGLPNFVLALKDGYFDATKIHYLRIYSNLVSFFVYLGSTTCFLPAVLILLFKKKYLSIRSFSIIISLLVTIFSGIAIKSPDGIQFFITLFAGLFLVTFTVMRLLDKKSDLLSKIFSIWVIAFIVIQSLVIPFNAARHILIILPPMIILITKELVRNIRKDRLKIIQFIIFFMTVSLGIMLSIADYKTAGMYKKIVSDVKQNFADNTVYFTGEWGFRWYMEQNGYTYLFDKSKKFNVGAFVIVPSIPCPVKKYKSDDRLILEKEVNYAVDFPVKTVFSENSSGFYSNGNKVRILPYSFEKITKETVRFFKIINH